MHNTPKQHSHTNTMYWLAHLFKVFVILILNKWVRLTSERGAKITIHLFDSMASLLYLLPMKINKRVTRRSIFWIYCALYWIPSVIHNPFTLRWHSMEDNRFVNAAFFFFSHFHYSHQYLLFVCGWY